MLASGIVSLYFRNSGLQDSAEQQAFAKRYHFYENVCYLLAGAFLYKENLTHKSYKCNICVSAVSPINIF